MIVTQTPFRITLGGGGTDLPSFYERHGGFVFAMTINKYVYLMLHRLPVTERKSIIRYSKVEMVDDHTEIQHPLVREAFRLHDLRDFVELTGVADLPARTGLGSSGAYLVGLLSAIRAFIRQPTSLQEIAEEACHIEIEVLREPVGKQDQYMSAYGGFRTLDISSAGEVTVGEVPVSFSTANELAHKARIYYTGLQRSATAVLKHQDEATRREERSDHGRVIDSLCHIKDIGRRILDAFHDSDLDEFGRLMDEHWQHKQRLSSRVTLSNFDDLYGMVKKEYGVLGGKIIGAGGGGFLMLYCPAQGRELDEYMQRHDMPRVHYFPSSHGSRVVTDLGDFGAFGEHAF